MPPRKRRRGASSSRGAAATSPTWKIPSDILLEIAAQTDTVTLIRCAAACKTLRREILHPDFIRRVCNERDGIVPATLTLGFLAESTFHLLHPATPAVVSLADDHLAPFLTRTAANLLEQYRPLTSRGGLVLLERRCVNMRRSDMCVYDPMTNSRAFFPFPSEVTSCRYEHRDHYIDHFIKYVLLTAADDGVGCSFFQLVAVDIMSGREDMLPLRVQTLSSDDGGEWGPVAAVYNPMPPGSVPLHHDNAAVVIEGVVHWLLVLGNNILTYNISTATAGLVRLPVDVNPSVSESILGSSPDGKLCLFTMDDHRMSICRLLSRSPAGEWRRRAVVDMKFTLRSLLSWKEWGKHWIELESSGDQRSGAVLLRLHGSGGRNELLVLDTETMKARRVANIAGLPFEVHLTSRVTAMKAV